MGSYTPRSTGSSYSGKGSSTSKPISKPTSSSGLEKVVEGLEKLSKAIAKVNDAKLEIERKELELDRLKRQLQIAEAECDKVKAAVKEELSTLSPDVRAAVTAMFDKCAPELGLDQGDEHTV